MEKKLNNEIRNLQSKLNTDAQKNKLHDMETLEISNKIDELINHYYLLSMQKRKFPTNSKMDLFYDASYKALKELTIKNNKFPQLEEWNKYAKENKLLSSESIKYISMLEWKYLKLRVNKEINEILE